MEEAPTAELAVVIVDGALLCCVWVRLLSYLDGESGLDDGGWAWYCIAGPWLSRLDECNYTSYNRTINWSKQQKNHHTCCCAAFGEVWTCIGGWTRELTEEERSSQEPSITPQNDEKHALHNCTQSIYSVLNGCFFSICYTTHNPLMHHHKRRTYLQV